MPEEVKTLSPEDALAVIDRQIAEMGVLGTVSYAKVTLPGTTEFMSDVIREVVSRQYSGYNDREVSRDLGKGDNYVQVIQQKHPLAFDTARADHAARVFYEYGRNIKVVSAALSKTGLIAVRTLEDLMRDPDAPPSVRLKAAVNALNMLSYGRGVKEKNAEDQVRVSIINEIQAVMADPENRRAIEVEAEDAEVIDGD